MQSWKLTEKSKKMYKNYFKRIFDFIAALIGLVLASPILVTATILLYFANDGKPFFFQLRPGKNQIIFKIVKFKTMNDKKDANGNLLSDELRLTKTGNIIRKTSIDEIPQLLNVLKGEMSLIGPRPLLPSYLPLYNKFENQRHNVRPGITGLTAVNGRNNISWQDKMSFDIVYANNVTFMMDFSIFFKTIKKIIQSDGVSKDGFISTDSFEEFCSKNPNRTYDS
jgi:undecaprenyl phosphate N,N'-diacetylbacillosamine 1-phosphate transferase